MTYACEECGSTWGSPMALSQHRTSAHHRTASERPSRPGIPGKTGDWHARNPLRVWRLGSLFTHAGLATQMGVSIVQIGRWERGESQPRMAQFRELAALMGVEPERLWGDWNRWMEEKPG